MENFYFVLEILRYNSQVHQPKEAIFGFGKTSGLQRDPTDRINSLLFSYEYVCIKKKEVQLVHHKVFTLFCAPVCAPIFALCTGHVRCTSLSFHTGTEPYGGFGNIQAIFTCSICCAMLFSCSWLLQFQPFVITSHLGSPALIWYHQHFHFHVDHLLLLSLIVLG